MTSFRRKHGRKLLLASVGLATATYLGCEQDPVVSGNLIAPPCDQDPTSPLCSQSSSSGGGQAGAAGAGGKGQAGAAGMGGQGGTGGAGGQGGK